MKEKSLDEQTATRGRWKCQPLPGLHTQIEWGERFTAEEFDVLARGFIPMEMEEKWFVFLEGDTLFCHRSWTGMGIYEVDFRREDKWHVASRVRINRDPEQYNSRDDERDLDLLRYLLRAVLLGQRVRFPALKGDSPPVAAVRCHSEMGAIRRDEKATPRRA